MKKIALILLLFIGLTLSFVAIGLVILFATGAVTSMDEAQALLSGQLPGGESAFLQSDAVAEVEDGLLLLQQQKQELEQQILTLQEDRTNLEAEKTTLSETVAGLTQQSQTGSADQAEQRAKRLEQLRVLYGAMRPADAAAVFDQMPDAMVLEILPLLKERQAARILNGLGDDARKATLSQKLLEGQM